jgi:hypothetical protein
MRTVSVVLIRMAAWRGIVGSWEPREADLAREGGEWEDEKRSTTKDLWVV